MALSYPTIQKKKTYAAPTTEGNTLANMSNPYEYNPGGSGDQAGVSSGTSSGTVLPQSYIGGQVQQRSALSSLPENLANSYQNTLAGMMSGDSYSAYKTSEFQGMNKSAQQFRANAQQANVGRAGQGTAIANKNATEAGIAQMAGDTALSAMQGEQEMKERGLNATNTLAGMNEDVRRADINQGMATDTSYGYIDPSTGEKVVGSNALAERQVDIEQQQANTTKELGYANIASNERLSGNQLNESARQFNITNDTDKAQFAETMKLNYDQLSEGQKQFLMNYGLDEAKFNQAKSEYTTNLGLEYQKLASNERIVTQQLGLGYAELQQAADQFGISTAEAAYQFSQKLNFDYASLSQEDKQFLESLGMDQAKFEESKREFDLNYSLEDKFRTKDLDLREQQLAQEGSQFADRLSFDRWATQAGLDDAEASRIWNATQNEKALTNAKEIATMQDDTERWKQAQVDTLTRAGWTEESARQTAEHTQQISMFNLQSALTKELESGEWRDKYGNTIQSVQLKQLAQQATQFSSAQDFEREMSKTQMLDENGKPVVDVRGKPVMVDKDLANRLFVSAERAASESWQKTQNTYNAQLQKELAAGQWTDEGGNIVESAQRVQLMSQLKMAESELTGMFDGKQTLAAQQLALEEALTKTQMIDPKTGNLLYNADGTPKMIDINTARNMIETQDRIENNIFQGNLQSLQNELALKGIKYQTTMNYLESLDEDQAHDILQAMALDAGVTYVVTDKDGKPIVDSKTGKPVTEEGFPPANFEASQKGYDLAIQLENGEIQSSNFRNGDDPKSTSYDNYQALLNAVRNYKMQTSYNSKAQRVNITNAPSKGSVIKMDGRVYLVVSDVTGAKNKADQFTVEDLATGDKKIIQEKW